MALDGEFICFFPQYLDNIFSREARRHGIKLREVTLIVYCYPVSSTFVDTFTSLQLIYVCVGEVFTWRVKDPWLNFQLFFSFFSILFSFVNVTQRIPYTLS